MDRESLLQRAQDNAIYRTHVEAALRGGRYQFFLRTRLIRGLNEGAGYWTDPKNINENSHNPDIN